MNIESIILRKVKMKMKIPFQTSNSSFQEREFTIVEVSDGVHKGYAECVAGATPYYSDETVKTSWHIMEDFLIPRVFAQKELKHPDDLQDSFSEVRRHSMAKAGIEAAIWDLYAKQQNKSLAAALGGTNEEVTVGISIGIQETPEELNKRIEEYLEQGYQKIKIKIKPGYDVKFLKEARQRFPDTPMMADANSAYTLEDIGLFKEMDDLGLLMFEQPLAHDDIVDHAILQKELQTPVCLDESIHSYEDARKALDLGSTKIINIKIGRVGGLSESIRIHDLCKTQGIPVWCGGMFESGIGRAHNLAISSLDNFTIPGDTAPSSRYWDEDIILPEITMNEQGKVQVPAGPGIGVDINEEVLNKHTEETKVFKSPH